MLESVGNQVPDGDLAEAVYQLVKEGGMNHREIFGYEEPVTFVKKVDREGPLGGILDYIVGKRKVESTEMVRRRGMPLKTLAAYLELLKEHQEEKEKQRKKQKAKQSMKNQTFN
jgi:hypothetical protein